ncbi:MAG: alpha/beta fold hydrolase [Actinobacteria bacterium]|nr:alpha/beta fold hydrolase [Actinomycetota bacterium]
MCENWGMRREAFLAATLAVVLFGAGCGSDVPEQVLGNVEYISTTSTVPPTTAVPTTAVPTTTTAVPTTTTEVPAGGLKWRPCEDLECSSIEVPMVHDDPSQGTIRIALNRYSARPGGRIGVLLVNPGGPGGSGVDLVADMGWILDQVVPGFDVIGFDPRGVGGSTPVACVEDLDDLVFVLEDNEDPAQLFELEDAFAVACLENSGDLALHVGTNSVARDMDLIREALGEEQISFLGYSYGSRIGAVYAAMFPDRVRAMVLDGPVDPAEQISSASPIQGRGFEDAWDNFSATCSDDPPCSLEVHGGAESAFATVDALLAEGDIPAGDRILTRGEFQLGVAMALYSPYTWGDLIQAFEEALDEGTGGGFQSLADMMMGRRDDGTYDNSQAVNFLVNCADDPLRPSQEAFSELVDAAADTFEHFGPSFRAMTGCGSLPESVDPLHVEPADLAVPVLVIALEGDPATPMAWARALADSIGDAVLITSDGEGHTAFLSNSWCVTDVVIAYLADLVVPEDGWSCVEQEYLSG